MSETQVKIVSMKINNILSQSKSRLWGLWIIVLLLWLTASWLVTGQILTNRINTLIHEETITLDKQAAHIADGITITLKVLLGIPNLVANEEDVIKALFHFNAGSFSSTLTTEQQKNIWSTDAQLKSVDAYLSLVGTSTGEDVIFIMNASGYCIASSNAGSVDSFVGLNLSAREYFQSAMSGKKGYQYAVGKLTNVPGLFFSAPVISKGHIVGVVATKINLPSLLHLVDQADAFITDGYGVIILASDAKFEMHSLPGASIVKLSKIEQIVRYKQDNFPLLAINPWPGQWSTLLQRLNDENQPLLMVNRNLLEDGTKVYVVNRLPEIIQLTEQRLVQFFLFGISGAIILLLFLGRFIFVRVRKNADIALQVSAQKYQLLFESSRDALMIVTPPTWKFTGANQATLDLFGASSLDEFLVLCPIDVSPELQPDGRSSKEKAQEAIEMAMREGSYIFEWIHKKLNGTTFIANVLLTRMGVGDELFLLATVRDISEQKRADDALYSEKIEQGILIKKLEEAQNYLLQSEKMASIGQLAAGVAHEINNPIGYVFSNLGSLEKYVQDTFVMLNLYEQAELKISDPEVLTNLKATKNKLDINFLKEDLPALIDESREGITRVKKIVQNLKDFSHLDIVEEWHFSDLHKGLDSTLNIVNNEIKYKADLVKEYGDIPEVECLSSQINQVFMNLVVNAAHAIEGHGTIKICTGQHREEVWVAVSDTGMGIPPEYIKKIFDPFFTTKPVGKGTGLGLSLSYSIIHNHHGRIDVQSEVGKGSTFTVWLPIKQNHMDSN